MEHKLTVYRDYINRMLSLPLDKESQNNKWKTVLNIARNSNFHYKLIINLTHQLQQYTPQDEQEKKNKTKWATFTYHNPKVRNTTNLLKHINLKIAFKINNTIVQLIRSKNNNTQIYNNSGIYKLTCKTCKQTYVGQISRNLKQCYQEHICHINPYPANVEYRVSS
jgi:hypothetical protein